MYRFGKSRASDIHDRKTAFESLLTYLTPENVESPKIELRFSSCASFYEFTTEEKNKICSIKVAFI